MIKRVKTFYYDRCILYRDDKTDKLVNIHLPVSHSGFYTPKELEEERNIVNDKLSWRVEHEVQFESSESDLIPFDNAVVEYLPPRNEHSLTVGSMVAVFDLVKQVKLYLVLYTIN